MRTLPQTAPPVTPLDAVLYDVVCRAVRTVLAESRPASATWLSADDAARHIGGTRRQLDDARRAGQIIGRRVGKRYVFAVADLDTFVAGRAVVPTQRPRRARPPRTAAGVVAATVAKLRAVRR